MKAVIMAGGEGTRLRPLTCGIPKPMIPILNKPVMEYTVDLLKKYEIEDIAVTMAYHPSVIVDYFGDGSGWKVNLNYFIEETPLGTGGSVKNAEDFLDDTFIIISGDALTDLDIREALHFHKQKNSKATLVLKKVAIPLEYGVVITDKGGRIIRFLEKPSWGEVFSDTINTGIYILEPEVLNYYKKGEIFDFSKDLFPKLLRDNIPMYGYVTDAYWNDIGDLKVYKEVNFDILNGKANVSIDYERISEGIWKGKNTVIDDTAQIVPPVLIGDHCIIKKDAFIKEAIIGDHTEIGLHSSIKNSILWKNACLENHIECRGAVICYKAAIKSGVHLYENTVIGNETVISKDAVIRPEIKIWPDKIVEEHAIVNQNLVWGTKTSKTLFGHRDVSGYINTDMSPEYASRLGSSFGAMLKMEGKVVLSSDNTGAAKLIKDSFASGILSTGVEVIDIEMAVIPINRYAVKFYKADGGIHIRQDHVEKNKIHIEFINENGINIDRAAERKLENIFAREDFKRCNAEDIKSAVHINNFSSFYIQHGSNLLKYQEKIKKAQPRLLVSSKSEHIVFLATVFLETIGCRVTPDYAFSEANKQMPMADENIVERFAENVVRQGASLGVLFSDDGESLVLVDHTGSILEKDKYLAMVSLILIKTGLKDRSIVIPNTASNMIEQLAAPHGIEVVRTKNSPAELLRAMDTSEQNNKDSLLQYVLNFDAIWGVGCLLDFLVGNGVSLNELVKEIPNFYLKKYEIPCDWQLKGRLMRELIEENKNNKLELLEGVKINNEKGWVLVLPDSEKPICNLYVEGVTEEYSQELFDFYQDRINNIVKIAESIH